MLDKAKLDTLATELPWPEREGAFSDAVMAYLRRDLQTYGEPQSQAVLDAAYDAALDDIDIGELEDSVQRMSAGLPDYDMFRAMLSDKREREQRRDFGDLPVPVVDDDDVDDDADRDR